MEILIAPDGTVRAIYSDALAPLLRSLGRVKIQRVSNVEPDPRGGWIADMSPVTPGLVLGPFALRSPALSAEVEWLTAHGRPRPRTGAQT